MREGAFGRERVNRQPSIRAVIAEDQQLIREGLAALLRNEDIEIVGEAEDGATSVELAFTLKPDIVLMDLVMPGLDGVAAIRRIKRVAPQVRVLILTGTGCDRRAAEALAAGADGYALKTQGHGDLVAAIRTVSGGRTYLAPGLEATRMMDYLDGTDVHAPSPLTARETEVLRLIAEGRRNREIAARLGIAIKTVETHRGKIMRKLDLHKCADLATYAFRNGLIA